MARPGGRLFGTMPGGTDLACEETTKRLGKRWPSRTGSDRPRPCQVVLADPDKSRQNGAGTGSTKSMSSTQSMSEVELSIETKKCHPEEKQHRQAPWKITNLSIARITYWSIARRKQISTFQSSLYGEPHMIYARHYVLTRTIFRTAHHSRCFLFRQIQQKDYINCPPGTVSRGISLWGGGLLQNSACPSHLQLSRGRVGGPSRQQVD